MGMVVNGGFEIGDGFIDVGWRMGFSHNVRKRALIPIVKCLAS